MVEGKMTDLIATRLPTLPSRPVGAPGPLGEGRDARAITTAARDFEAMFVAEMLKPVFETLPEGGAFSGGPGEKVFRSLMVQEYGKAVAASGGVGIAQVVEQAMLARQNGDGDA